jgi:hypothetical protein
MKLKQHSGALKPVAPCSNSRGALLSSVRRSGWRFSSSLIYVVSTHQQPIVATSYFLPWCFSPWCSSLGSTLKQRHWFWEVQHQVTPWTNFFVLMLLRTNSNTMETANYQWLPKAKRGKNSGAHSPWGYETTVSADVNCHFILYTMCHCIVSKPIACTTSSMNSNVKLWVVTMYLCRSTNCSTCTTVIGDIENGADWHIWRQGQ